MLSPTKSALITFYLALAFRKEFVCDGIMRCRKLAFISWQNPIEVKRRCQHGNTSWVRQDMWVPATQEEHLTDDNIHGRRGKCVVCVKADEFLFSAADGHVTGAPREPQIPLNAQSQKHMSVSTTNEARWSHLLLNLKTCAKIPEHSVFIVLYVDYSQ